MTEEIINAAIMQLRARATESYGIMKDMCHQPAQEGDMDRLTQQALRLAQLEGAMLTLQQYSPNLIEALKERPPEEEAEEENIVTPEMSPTMARVAAVHEASASEDGGE